MTPIISTANLTVNTKEFKDTRLAEATRKIANIYSDAAKYADTKNREVAKILATIADQKLYVQDGFKSVAEYAADTFGIQKANAYALASAGKVYNDPKAPKALKEFTPSKLSEVAKVDHKKLEAAIADGTISKDTTQKDLRTFAAENTPGKSKKAEIVNEYTAKVIGLPVNSDFEKELTKPRSVEDWETYFTSLVMGIANRESAEAVKIPKGYNTMPNGELSKKPTIERRLFLSGGTVFVVEFHIPVKKTEPKKPKFTREQLMAMLAEMDGDENG